MNFNWRNPFTIFGLVLLWRLALLVFTAQPIPANDAFGYDGAVVNLLHGGNYCNPALALIFPISGTQVFSMYPPLYQVVLLVWMKAFGTSVLSAMALHLALFAAAGFLVLNILKKFFPAGNYLPAALLFFGFTFGDRPEDLAFIFGFGSLGLGLRQISAARFGPGSCAAIACLLLLALYTSPIVGAYFFGIGFLMGAMVWWRRRAFILLLPFFLAAAGFALLTLAIIKVEPLWWAGFMESAGQQSVVSRGFHLPAAVELLRLARAAPVFLVSLAALPVLWRRRKELLSATAPWLYLVVAIFAAGWLLLLASQTLLASNYVGYVMFTQILLAAGLLALSEKFFTDHKKILGCILVGCVVLVSIRALGMTTWGVACAWKNSHARTQEILHTEFQPFTNSDEPVLVSSAFMYDVSEIHVKHALLCDWYFDHAHWTNDADVIAFIRLKPAKLALTQFDYYRGFTSVLEKLSARTNLVEFTVHDFTGVRTPDSIPSLQRVVQHISWAPVIVDLHWQPDNR